MCTESKDGHNLAECINCQVLGMQKVVDVLLRNNENDAAVKVVTIGNMMIASNSAFRKNAEHILSITMDDAGRSMYCKLIPHKFA